MNKYVFPEGELVTISQALEAAESAGFEVRDVENLREHYELTLRRWIAALQENTDELLTQVSETTYRTWLLYIGRIGRSFSKRRHRRLSDSLKPSQSRGQRTPY